jgi:hypothetical protein
MPPLVEVLTPPSLGYHLVMAVPRIQLSLESLAQMCRRLHTAAVHEAELAQNLAGMREQCVASPVLWRSYNNILSQLKSQVSDPFVTGIPECSETLEAIELPMLTSQLLGAVLALAAPTMTSETVTRTWDDSEDAAYDAL